MRKFIRLLFGPACTSRNRNPNVRGLALERLEDRLVPATLDLTTAGAHGSIGSVLFQQSGSHFGDHEEARSFVSLHANGQSTVAQGYNTDARPVQFDEVPSPFLTHSLQLSQVPLVTINGVAYRQFVLTVNQNHSSPLLSLDELRLYMGSTPKVTGYDPATMQLGGLTPVYDLDAGGANTVLLSGSHRHNVNLGTILVDVPDALLTEPGGNYVYLYSKFGVTDPVNGGVEEWAVQEQHFALSSLSGFVSSTGQNPGPLAGVTVTLTGVSFFGKSITLTTQTDANGFFLFSGLLPGTYSLTQTLPSNYQPGTDTAGTLGGSVGVDQFSSLHVPPGAIGRNYDFGDILTTGGGGS
jgi:hypothetical protein